MRNKFHADGECSSLDDGRHHDVCRRAAHHQCGCGLRCVSASLFVMVNEWQYNDILDDIDKLSWEEMSEDCTPTCRKGVPAR